MATTSLLEAIPSIRKSKLQTLNWNPLLQTIPTQLPLRSTKHTAALINSLKFSKKGSYFTVKCIANSINSNIGVEEKRNNAFSFDRVVEVVLKALKALQKPAITAVMLGLLLMYDPHAALAASGGRMGGSSFSSHSSSSSSSSSGDYGDYFTKSSSPSYIYSKSSSPSYIYSAPYYAASPFGFTGGGGGGLYSGTEGVAITGGGGWLYSEPASVTVFLMCLVPLFVFLSGRSEGSVLTATQKTSVIKIQVGLLGMARSLQRDLDRIAEVADTSTSEGLSYVLTETTLALLRQPDCCISGYSSVDIKNSTEDGENRFNHLSIEERGKFDEETLVNVNNIKRKGSRSRNGNGFSNEYIVITILVAAEGVTKLPYINSSADLKEALQKLASIPASKTMAVEVLWTPQNENDILTERQLLEDYPLLMPL